MPVTWMPKVDWLSKEGQLREQLDAEWAKIQAELRSRRTLQLPTRPTELPFMVSEAEPFEGTPSLSTAPTTTTPIMPAWASVSRKPSTTMPSFLTTPPWQPQEEKPLQFIEPISPEPIAPRRRTILEQPPIVPEVKAPEEPSQPEGKSFWGRALGVLETPLKFIHEKLELPFASVITSPWSPSLSWNKGESWLAHQKREYETWKAPKFVKGITEFAMPLWWIPWLGWAGKGAKAMGVGSKMARALETLPQAGKLELPTKGILNETLYKPDLFKRIALLSEGKPVIGGVIKAIGGPSAFVRAPMVGESAEQIVKREIVNRAVLRDMRSSVQGLMIPRLRVYGTPIKVLGVTKEGLVESAIPKVKNTSRYLYDVVEHPDAYTFATKESKAYIDEVHKVLGEIRELATKEGVVVPKDVVVHRIVKGVKTLDKEGLEQYEKSEFGSLFEVKRRYATMQEGVKAGVDYGLDINESVASTINHYIKKIADKRFDDELKKLGVSPLDKITEQAPQLVRDLIAQSAKLDSANFALKTITKLKSYHGTSIAGATMGKIRNGLPDVAQKIDDLLAITPKDVDKIISSVSRELRQSTKLSPREFKIILSQYQKVPGKIRLGEIDDTIRQLNISNDVASKMIAKIYQQAYTLNKATFDNGIVALQNELKAMSGSLKSELSPLKSQYRKLAEKYTMGQQILGEGEEIMRRRPSLRGAVYPREAFPKARPHASGLIFPKDIVDLVEKATYDKGIEWVRNVSAISGTSRMLTAAMDTSAPFIQGLAVLGRNPVAWAKGVGRMFEFLASPQRLYKYMADPVNMAVRAERVSFGGSSSSWEFFEALAPLQRGVEKIPGVGGVGKRVIGETYGRAEAAFTGFSEVARNEMWKALKRPTMGETQLRELSRTIDRMTGVMSTEALGIGVTQRDLENAFVFFAPRYTRASLSFVGDVLKGGMTGAEARKSLGGLMAGGMAMYFGISKALGQEPNLNPRSGRFMTIKVGDSYVGVGGITYGLMRLSANIATTAVSEPLDLARLNRYDNPFIRFMYQRTAPVTGMAVSAAIEQKDYFGQPFESVADWGKFLAEKVTPIAVQQTWGEGKTVPLVFAAGVAGGRTFPKSAWELREDARDRYAIELLGKPYKDIPEIIQRQIDERPDIKALTAEADKRTVQIGEGLSVGFLNRQRDRDDARFMYEESLWQLQKAVDEGVITPFEFREEMQKTGYGLGRTYEFIDSREQYQDVLKKLQEPKDISGKFIGDVAYSELMSGLYGGQFEDEFGLPLWEKRQEFEDMIRQKYGEEIWQYIQEKEIDRHKTLPPLAQEYYTAQRVMKPYWAIRDEVARFLNPESPRGQRLITKLRKRLRRSDPEIEKYFQMFYVQP